MTKKAALYTPYADTLGGGERYLLTLAQILLDLGWQVEATIDDNELLAKSRQRFNLPLKNLDIISKKNLDRGGLRGALSHRQYDLLFWVSDGSIPTMMAKKNWLHFQVPFHNLNGRSLFNIIKLKSIDKIICNSYFTKKIIDQEYGTRASVWYPPVAINDFSPGKKENIIVAVGRFETTMNVKRQDVLVSVFKKGVDEGLSNWKLILIGGSLGREKDNQYLQKLKKQAHGYPVEFRVNAPFRQLKETYGLAKIFWHAAGYGINEEKEPERVEHFGMTTIEAMAAGCWPLVYNAGGQKEIFSKFSQKNLCLWNSKEELLTKTKKIIDFAPQQDQIISLINEFSVKSFTNHVKKAL